MRAIAALSVAVGLALIQMQLVVPGPANAAAPTVFSQAATTLTPTAAGYQTITVQKALCATVNSNTQSCNGNDTSLSGYTVTFDVYHGTSPGGTLQGQVNVTLSGGFGSTTTAPLPDIATYTVCEEPVARSGSQSVALDAHPLISGSNQSFTVGYSTCLTVNLTGQASNSVLGFNNVRSAAAPVRARHDSVRQCRRGSRRHMCQWNTECAAGVHQSARVTGRHRDRQEIN
ncbi:MAG: hypothetical protein JOZ87_26790 [Chloroflexi bacterium]|nr:hypothetical protein [Chloroflexota bacterium]